MSGSLRPRECGQGRRGEKAWCQRFKSVCVEATVPDPLPSNTRSLVQAVHAQWCALLPPTPTPPSRLFAPLPAPVSFFLPSTPNTHSPHRPHSLVQAVLAQRCALLPCRLVQRRLAAQTRQSHLGEAHDAPRRSGGSADGDGSRVITCEPGARATGHDLCQVGC